MKKIALAAVALSLVCAGTATAADMAVKAPPPPVATCFWCGFYIGGNVGYGWGKTDIVGSNFYTGNLAGTTPGIIHAYGMSNDMKGWLGGGQVGYNTQLSPNLVVGVEADIQYADLKSSGNAFVPLTAVGVLGLNPNSLAVATSQHLDWFGTVRGRVGFTPVGSPNLLLYGTAGVAFGPATATVAYADFFPNVPATISGVG